MDINLELPINSLGLGQMGWGVAYEIYKRGLEPNIFPLGNVDLRSFKKDTNFEYWLQQCINKSVLNFNKNQKSITLWHINGALKTFGDESILWTAHETSEATPAEVNILKSYKRVYFTSQYSCEIFKAAGLENVEWCPNFFDEIHFHRIPKEKDQSAPIEFSLIGKLERRKNTRNIMIAWANMFANKKEFRLNCSIFNPFLDPQQQSGEINGWFGGRLPSNINILPFIESNEEFNKVLNNTDIDLSGLSGAEGWGLPCFNNLCLGNQCVVLNAHAHKDYSNSDNSILVEPSHQEEIYDGQFFQKGAPFNQGSMYFFNQDAAHEAFKKAVDNVKKGCKFEERADLMQKFSVNKTVDTLLQT